MKPEYEDHPFWEVCSSVSTIIQDKSADVYQKFTCAGCGQRLTIDEPNKFYKIGTCDKCSTVTNIEKQGCNYLIHYHAIGGDP